MSDVVVVGNIGIDTNLYFPGKFIRDELARDKIDIRGLFIEPARLIDRE